MGHILNFILKSPLMDNPFKMDLASSQFDRYLCYKRPIPPAIFLCQIGLFLFMVT